MSDVSKHQMAVDEILKCVTTARAKERAHGKASETMASDRGPRGGRHERQERMKASQKLIILLAVEKFGKGNVQWAQILQENKDAFDEKRTPASLRHAYARMQKAACATKTNKCRDCGNPSRGHICFVKLQREAVAEDKSARVAVPMFKGFADEGLAMSADSATAEACA